MLRDGTATGVENGLTFSSECNQAVISYNNCGQRPAASGQRPAASGQRPAASGHDPRPAAGRRAQAGFPDLGGLATGLTPVAGASPSYIPPVRCCSARCRCSPPRRWLRTHGGAQTFLTTTLTVDQHSGLPQEFGCDDSTSQIAHCSAALASAVFAYEGYTVFIGEIEYKSDTGILENYIARIRG